MDLSLHRRVPGTGFDPLTVRDRSGNFSASETFRSFMFQHDSVFPQSAPGVERAGQYAEWELADNSLVDSNRHVGRHDRSFLDHLGHPVVVLSIVGICQRK